MHISGPHSTIFDMRSFKKILYIVGICSIVLFCSRAEGAKVDDYVKNIEDVESHIKFDRGAFPPAAYLYIELKNNGDKNIANLTFEINYSDTGGYPMKKAILKNALTEPLPRGETRKYRILLKGDIVFTGNAQYPYERSDQVGDFDIKILKIKFARK